MLIFLAIFQSLNAILAIFGNSLVIYLVLTRRTLKTVGNIFVVNLAITDLGYGLFEIVTTKEDHREILSPRRC